MHGLPFEILLVDEDADDRFFMDEAFKIIGYEAEVKKFITGKALLQYLEQIDASLYPSVIVINDRPPGTDTEHLLTTLKVNPAYQSISVVVYTGFALPGRKDELLSMGAYAYIEKGTSVYEIVNIAKKFQKLAESRVER